ncbi:phosphatidylinositol transfer protein csr1 [Coemansia javaensis]|uniref:Phosphatidylinositol transfer protein csr1 n=1 Tax=Coemansia javaensis TaxID=2761396 RepID=A0A9W8H4H1_9FUNG|nr:phosphatidylinositol transfer protein csr1 [Coemansia javaensis]
MTVCDIPEAQEQYKAGKKSVGGAVGDLDSVQEAALRELWGRVLAHFDATADAPIAVDSSLARLDGPADGDAERAADARHQTVRDKLHLDGAREAVVPATFAPLFGDPADSRRFSHAFWQACMRVPTPDAYLLAFLRVAGWSADVAFGRVVAAVTQRARQEVDRLMWDGDLGISHGLMVRGLSTTAGRDRFGYPVYIVTVRANNPRARSDDAVRKYAAYALEKLAIGARRAGRATLLYDFTDFKLENVDTAFTKTVITRIAELYPQTISATLLFVNSWLFTGIWKVLRGWMDQAVARRTVVVKDAAALATFVDRNQIVASMGGGLEYTYQYAYPTRAENAAMFDAAGRAAAEAAFAAAVAAFVAQTKAWVADPALGHNCAPRAQAAAAFDAAATALDPFVRARFPEERAS